MVMVVFKKFFGFVVLVGVVRKLVVFFVLMVLLVLGCFGVMSVVLL